MPRQSRIRELLDASGKPLDELLIELYSEHGSIKAMADYLSVPQSTLQNLLMRQGLRVVSRLDYAPIPYRLAGYAESGAADGRKVGA